jgi:hypothetical protein
MLVYFKLLHYEIKVCLFIFLRVPAPYFHNPILNPFNLKQLIASFAPVSVEVVATKLAYRDELNSVFIFRYFF